MKNYSKNLRYYSRQIFDTFGICFTVFFCLIAPILTILLCYYLNSHVLYYSTFIISIVYQVIAIINLSYWTYKLFAQPRTNLQEFKILGLNQKRMEMFWIRLSLMLIMSGISIISMVVFGSITLGILKTELTVINAFAVSNAFGLLFNILFLTPLFVIIASLAKKGFEFVGCLLTGLVFPATSLVSNYALADKKANNDLSISINEKDRGGVIKLSITR